MEAAIRAVDACLQRHLTALCREKGGALTAQRQAKFRRMGTAQPMEEA